jgi:hypothetical protein
MALQFRFVYILILTFTISLAQEKKTKIAFEYYTHDFGTIKEEGGNVSYEFVFSNVGNFPLIIKDVQTACGCTVPNWSKEQILPRGSGKILVEFNPINKPGVFTKTLTVYSNSENETALLNITGKVMPKPRKPADDFPDFIGNIRMISRYMNFGEISTEKPITKDFWIYNQSDTNISIQKINYASSFMKVTMNDKTILPKSKTKVTVEYDPNLRKDFGYIHDKVELVTNDKINPIKTLFVAATISKFFPVLTDLEKQNAPKINTLKHVHDFGLVKQGEKQSTTFILKNEGRENLIIYKVKPSCGCTVAELDKKILAPNDEAKLHIIFDTAGKDGFQEKHINIYCNDPKSFNLVLTLKAKITK